MVRTPRTPISREAKEYLRSKLDRMKGIERKKAEKRLEMYDRGFVQKKEIEVEYGD